MVTDIESEVGLCIDMRLFLKDKSKVRGEF